MKSGLNCLQPRPTLHEWVDAGFWFRPISDDIRVVRK